MTDKNAIVTTDGYYRNFYTKVLSGGSIGTVVDLVHRSLERDVPENFHAGVVLELGAGHGQHKHYVHHSTGLYIETDLRESLLPQRPGSRRVDQSALSAAVAAHSGDGHTTLQAGLDAQDLSAIPSESIDRIIASCLLVHLPYPEKALSEWRRVARHGSIVTIYVAPEPGIVLRLGRACTTVRRARKLGTNHLSFHYREHINHFPAMKMLIGDTFASDEIRWRAYPIPYASWNFSLWKVTTIRVRKPEQALD